MMRHSTITLTMDDYGYLFPGQEARAVGQLQVWMGPRNPAIADAKPTSSSTECGGSDSTGDSKRSAIPCVNDAMGCETDEDSQLTKTAETIEKTGARSDPLRPVTMPCLPSCPHQRTQRSLSSIGRAIDS